MPDRGLGTRARGLNVSYIQPVRQVGKQAGGKRDRFARTHVCAQTEAVLKWAGRSLS